MAVKSRGHDGDVPVAFFEGVDELEDLAFVSDGAEGAGYQAHTAGNALVIVDLGTAVIVGFNGVHAAGGGAGALLLDDGVVGTGIGAFTASDALAVIDHRLAALKMDGTLGADLLAEAGQAALAALGDPVPIGGTGVAGIGNNVHQRGIIVLFRDGTFFHTVGQPGVLRHRTQRQTHCQTDALAHNGALQEDGFPVIGNLAGGNLVGQFLHAAVVAAFICQAGNLCKDLLPVGSQARCDASSLRQIHSFLPLYIVSTC